MGNQFLGRVDWKGQFDVRMGLRVVFLDDESAAHGVEDRFVFRLVG